MGERWQTGKLDAFHSVSLIERIVVEKSLFVSLVILPNSVLVFLSTLANDNENEVKFRIIRVLIDVIQF